jgi:hypothetical protein
MQARPQLLNRQAQRSCIEIISTDVNQDELSPSRLPAQEGDLPGAQWAGAVKVQGEGPIAIHVQPLMLVQVFV